MSWFPLPKNLMEDSPDFRLLTPTEKLFFWNLVSRYNLGGEFYQSDLEMAKTLRTTEKTIRRGRAKLVEHGFIEAKSGSLTKRKQCLATTYSMVRYADVKQIESGVFFAQMHRHAFNAMLNSLRKKVFNQAHIVVYVYLSYWYWKMRGAYIDNEAFELSKKTLQDITSIKNTPKLIDELYINFQYSSGRHLYEYQDKHQRFVFTQWATFADPEDDKQALICVEKWVQEVIGLVEQEKNVRLLRKEQQIAQVAQKISEGDSPTRNIGSLFDYLYKKKYDRWPNTRNYEVFEKLWLTYGKQAINRAINYYFTADSVPNSSGAKTRTLGNFIAHIEEILRLTHESQHN